MLIKLTLKHGMKGFPGGSVVNNPPVNAGDTGLIPAQEDPTGHGAANGSHGSHEPQTQGLRVCNITTAACTPRALAFQQEKPLQ